MYLSIDISSDVWEKKLPYPLSTFIVYCYVSVCV